MFSVWHETIPQKPGTYQYSDIRYFIRYQTLEINKRHKTEVRHLTGTFVSSIIFVSWCLKYRKIISRTIEPIQEGRASGSSMVEVKIMPSIIHK